MLICLVCLLCCTCLEYGGMLFTGNEVEIGLFIFLLFLCILLIGDRKDQKALDKLRAERQAIIDELKEKTNYYTTQQLIQVIRPRIK